MWWIISSVLFSQWTALLAVVLALLYKWATANHKYFEKQNIAFEKPLPLVGNLWEVIQKRENYAETIQRFYAKFKHNKV